jgi:hypothetical protein
MLQSFFHQRRPASAHMLADAAFGIRFERLVGLAGGLGLSAAIPARGLFLFLAFLTMRPASVLC